jgi:hypothetical protein
MATALQLFAHLTEPNIPPAVTFTGTYNATITARFADSPLLAQALPGSFELLPDPSFPSGKHPLVITFGLQQNVVIPAIPGPLNYAESVIGIPNVGIRGSAGSGPAIYMPRLDVNNLIAVGIGLAIGYQKHFSFITGSADEFMVQALLTRELILKSAFRPDSDWESPAAFPNLDFVCELLRQPLLSIDVTGRTVFSQFQWHFDDDNALFRGGSVQMHVATDLPALLRGDYSWGSFSSASMGGGQIIVPWTLLGPFVDRP